MTPPPTPGEAACEAFFKAQRSDLPIREVWEIAGRAAVAAYTEANGRDPAGARAINDEAAAPELARLREVIDQFTRHAVWPDHEIRKVNGWRKTAGLPPLDAAS